MARKQVRDPLQGREPSVQPTSQPRLSVPRGAATPPPRTNALARLGKALEEINPEVSQALFQRHERLEKEAAGVGAAVAEELGASAEMEEIQAELKRRVDEGELDRGWLPVAEQNAGKRLAFNRAQKITAEDLYSRFDEVSRLHNRTDPETVISEVRERGLESIPDDPEAREVFLSTFSRQSNAFFQEATKQFIENQKKHQDATRAETLDDYLTAVSASDTTQSRQEQIQRVGDFIETHYKPEMNKRQVAETVATDAAPLIRDLISEGETDEAEEIMNVIEDYDLTGNGGKLGKVSGARNVLTNLRNELLSRSDDSYQQMAKERRRQEAVATEAFRSDVVNLEGPLTEREKDRLVSEFAQNHEDEPHARFLYEKQLDQEIQQGNTTDQEVFTEIKRSITQLDTDDAKDKLETASQQGLLSAQDQFDLEQSIAEVETLSPVVRPELRDQAQQSIYQGAKESAFNPETGSTVTRRTPVFESTGEFQALDSDLQFEHRQEVLDFFMQEVRNGVRETGSLQEAQANLPRIRNEAKQAAIKYADKVTQQLLDKQQQKQQEQDVDTSIAENLKQNGSLDQVNRVRFKEEFESLPDDPARLVQLAQENEAIPRSQLPGEDFEDQELAVGPPKFLGIPTNPAHPGSSSALSRLRRAYQGDFRGSLPPNAAGSVQEAIDFAQNKYLREHGPSLLRSATNSKEISKSLRNRINTFAKVVVDFGMQNKLSDDDWKLLGFDPEKMRQIPPSKSPRGLPKPAEVREEQPNRKFALQKYMFQKTQNGFQPAEILSGTTEEGVPFDPSQIDPWSTPLFESLEQLEQEWNNGSPSRDSIFYKIGDRIDPQDRLNAAQFYHAQYRLLRSRPQEQTTTSTTSANAKTTNNSRSQQPGDS